MQSLENLLRRVLISENIPVEHLEYWTRNIPTTNIQVTYLGKTYSLIWVLPKTYMEITDEEFDAYLRQIAYNRGVGSAQGVWEVGIRGIRAATLPYELRRLCNSGTRWIDPMDFVQALTQYDGIPDVAESLDALSQGIVTAALDHPLAFADIAKYLEVCLKYPRLPINTLADLNKIDLRVFPIPSRVYGALLAWLRQNGKDAQPTFTAFVSFVQSENLASVCRMQQASALTDLCTGVINWVNTRQGTFRDLAVTILTPNLASDLGWKDLSTKKAEGQEVVISKELLDKISLFWEDDNPSQSQIEFFVKWKDFLAEGVNHQVFEQMSQDFSGVK